MSKFSAVANLHATEPKKGIDIAPVMESKMVEATMRFHEEFKDVTWAINQSKPIQGMINMELAAIGQLQKNRDYRGIIDILSRGNIETFHKRLGISNEDLFQRSQSGIRDVYVSSLTEDVTNFIGNLWEAVKNAIQKVYDWSINLSSDQSKIGICKAQLTNISSAIQSKGSVSIAIDMTDPEDWKTKAAEVLKLYQVLEEIMTSAAQSITAGQLTENALQDQLLGKMQRANIMQIKLNIQDGSKSSSFQFPGVGSGRIEVKDAGQLISELNELFNNQILPKIDALNKAVAAYAQNITTAQTQYKCNTDCAAVVSNISSATQMITKSIVSVNSYVSESLASGLIDIVTKIQSATQTMPEAAPATTPAEPEKITPAIQEQQPAQQAEQQPEQPAQQEQAPAKTEEPAQQ